jgi:hypothetical protein
MPRAILSKSLTFHHRIDTVASPHLYEGGTLFASTLTYPYAELTIIYL